MNQNHGTSNNPQAQSFTGNAKSSQKNTGMQMQGGNLNTMGGALGGATNMRDHFAQHHAGGFAPHNERNFNLASERRVSLATGGMFHGWQAGLAAAKGRGKQHMGGKMGGFGIGTSKGGPGLPNFGNPTYDMNSTGGQNNYNNFYNPMNADLSNQNINAHNNSTDDTLNFGVQAMRLVTKTNNLDSRMGGLESEQNQILDGLELLQQFVKKKESGANKGKKNNKD